MSLNELLAKNDPEIKREQIQVVVDFQEAQKKAAYDAKKREDLDKQISNNIKNANDMVTNQFYYQFNLELYQKLRSVKSPENQKPTLIGFIFPKMVCLFHLMRAKIYYDIYLKKKIAVRLDKDKQADSQIIQTYVFNEKIYIVHFSKQKETQLYQVYNMEIKDLFQRDGEAAVTFFQIPYCIMQDYGTLVEIEDSALLFVGRDMTIIVEDQKKNLITQFKDTQKRKLQQEEETKKKNQLYNQSEDEKKRQKFEADNGLEEIGQHQYQYYAQNDQFQQQNQYQQMPHNIMQNVGGGQNEQLYGLNQIIMNQKSPQPQKIQGLQQYPLNSNNPPALLMNAGSSNNQPLTGINYRVSQQNPALPSTMMNLQATPPLLNLLPNPGFQNHQQAAPLTIPQKLIPSPISLAQPVMQNPPQQYPQPQVQMQRNQPLNLATNQFFNQGTTNPPQILPGRSINIVPQSPLELFNNPSYGITEQQNQKNQEPAPKEPNPEDDIQFVYQIPEYCRRDCVVTSKRKNDLIIIQNTNMIYEYSLFPIQDFAHTYGGHSQAKNIDTTLNFQGTIYGFLFNELNSKRVFVYEIPDLKQQFACEVKNKLPFLQLQKIATSSNDMNNRICCFLGAAKYNNLQVELPVIVVFNRNDRTFEVELI